MMMRKETKDVIYMVLDLLESLAKTSQSNAGFIGVDKSVLKQVKSELMSLLTQSVETFGAERTSSKKTELIGVLPSVLIDRQKFPSNEDIAKLARRSLDFEIPFWKKRSRNEMIGIVIAKIAVKQDKELELFLRAWKDFIRDTGPEEYKAHKKDFVEVWLDFFDHYKGAK